MSHNASAIVSDEVHASDIVSGQIYFRGYQANGSWTSWLNSSYTSSSIQTIRKFQLRNPSNGSISSNWGDYFTIPVYVLYPGANGQWNTVGNVTASAENVNCPIRDITMSQTQSHVYNGSTDSKQTNQRNLYIITCQVANANYTDLEINFQVGVNNNNSGTYTMNFVGGYTRWRPDSEKDYSTILNTINNSIIANGGKLDQVKSAINNLGSKIDDTNDKLDDIIENQNKEENTANENVEQNESDSNDSSDDAANASQSLISAIGGFVSAITSASPSNCRIDGDMGKVDMGQIDLCANPVPTYMQIISSLILICICIPFAIIMFNRFIALFRSFQS